MKNENELKKMQRASLLKMIVIAVIVVLFVVFSSVAWFTMNREVEGAGVQMTATGENYMIKTANSDNSGAYYNTYHSLIKESGAAVWLVDSSNLGNNTNSGIRPGSFGKMTFYVTPLVDEVHLDFEFRLIGYKADERGNSVTMTELSSNVGGPAYFLNGHLLLFEGKTGNYYNDFIPVNENRIRTISRTFRKSEIGSNGVDTDNDNVNDAIQVDIHWIWPETLSTLINTGDNSIQLICDSTVQAQEGETTDYQQVKNFMISHPSYFLKGYDASSTVSDTALVNSYSDYGSLYDRADQDIGSEVHFILLKMEVKETTS